MENFKGGAMKIGIILISFFAVGYLYFYNQDIKMKKSIDKTVKLLILKKAVNDPEKFKKVIKEEYGYDTTVYRSEHLKKGVISYDELLFITQTKNDVIKSCFILNTLTGEAIQLTTNKAGLK